MNRESMVNNLKEDIVFIDEYLNGVVDEISKVMDEYWGSWKSKNESIAKQRAAGITKEYPGEIAPSIETPNKDYPLNKYFILKRYSKLNNFRKHNPKAGQRITATSSRSNTLGSVAKYYNDNQLKRITPDREWEYELLKELEEKMIPLRELYAIHLAHRKQLQKMITRLTKGASK